MSLPKIEDTEQTILLNPPDPSGEDAAQLPGHAHEPPGILVVLAERTQARMGRGAGRIWTRSSAFARGDGLDWKERLSRWGVMGAATAILGPALAAEPHTAEACLGLGVAALAGACLIHGGALDNDQPQDPHTSQDPDHELEFDPFPAPLDQVPTPVRDLVPEPEVFAAPSPPPADGAESLIDALRTCGITGPKVLSITRHTWGELVELEMPRGAKVLNDRLDDLEAALRLPMGGLSFQINPRDAGIVSLRMRRTDPFTGLGAPYHHRPRSLTVRQALDVGLEMDGAPLLLMLARVHLAVVGGTGSGKSSALWTLIDSLSACEDVVIWGIDLTGSPGLKAWGSVIQELATTPDQAKALLEKLLKMGRGRTAELGDRSTPRLGQPLPDLASENWRPSPQGPQIVLIVDEYPALVEAGLWPYVAMILKELRKGAVTLILASQRATKDELGTSTVKAQIGLKVLLSCDPQDVQLLLGAGMRAKGWTPDRLLPALNEDPYDAGIAYIHGGAHIRPVPKKFYRLELPEVYRRAMERMQAGLPSIDPATLAHATDPEPIHIDLNPAPEDLEPEQQPLTNEQSHLLHTLAAAMTTTGAVKAHLRTLVQELAATGEPQWQNWTAADLGAALTDAGLTPVHSVKIDRKVTVGIHLNALADRLDTDPDDPQDDTDD
jgi:FtsK/SpoIIIE family